MSEEDEWDLTDAGNYRRKGVLVRQCDNGWEWLWPDEDHQPDEHTYDSPGEAIFAADLALNDSRPDVRGIALELHANRYGSSDSYATWCQPEGTKDAHLDYLKGRILAWNEARTFGIEFDNAVRAVLIAAIREWEPEWRPEVNDAS